MNFDVAKKSAAKTAVTGFFMALGVTILGAAADFFMNTDVLSSIFSSDSRLLILVPLLALAGQFLKDWIKHSGDPAK